MHVTYVHVCVFPCVYGYQWLIGQSPIRLCARFSMLVLCYQAVLLTAYRLPKLTHLLVHVNNLMEGNKEELQEDHRAQ